MVQMQSQAQAVNPVSTSTYQPMKGQGLGQMSNPKPIAAAPLLKKKGWPKGVKRKSRGATYS
jgi:hypothetical protein